LALSAVVSLPISRALPEARSKGFWRIVFQACFVGDNATALTRCEGHKNELGRRLQEFAGESEAAGDKNRERQQKHAR